MAPVFGSRNAKWKGGPIEYVCEVCGTKRNGQRGRPNRFCSRRCMGLSERTLVGAASAHWRGGSTKRYTCLECGEYFIARRDRRRKFCSTVCYGASKSRVWAKRPVPGMVVRRARLKAAGPWPLPARVRSSIKAAANYTCLSCGKAEPEIELTMDHIVPVARGGSNDPSNIQALCLKCNIRKRHRMPTQEVA